MSKAVLLDHRGQVIESAPKPRAGLAGEARNFFPYDAANFYSPETEGWFPWVNSPDHEVNVYRDRMVARSRDLRRNDGWASGGITSVLDEAIGSQWRLSSQPDYRALAYFDKSFDAAWAAEFKHAFEARWRTFAEDPNFYCDATQQLTFVQMMRLALACKLVDGEDLVKLEWEPDNVFAGGAHYATSIRLVDPDRLSNPMEMVDTMYLRGGVEINRSGIPLAYHIRQAHQNDWYGTVQSMIWDRIPRRTDWGRPIVVHDYDHDRVDQHRGVPIYVPVMNRLKMLTTYDRAELQAAVINAIFSLSVTSPYDPEGMKDALDAGGKEDLWYWQQRRDYREQKPLSLQEARILNLFPGEKAEALKSERPNAQHDPFTDYALRHVAAQLGTTAEKVTKNWSKMNYSSARAAMLDARKTVKRRVGDFAAGTCNPLAAAVLEEMMDRRELPMPAKAHLAPEFSEARAAFARLRWIGPGQGWIDPVKEAQAGVLRMDAAFSTGELECADQGHDFEENLDQRAREIQMMKDRKIPLPDWARGGDAAQDEEKPRPA